MTVISTPDLEKNRLEIIQSVPWASEEWTVKKRSFPKGEVPAHLKKYLFKKNDVVKQCADLVPKELKGKEKIQKINECVSEKLSKK